MSPDSTLERTQTPTRDQIPPVTDAEREVADLLPIEAPEGQARGALDSVPVWFHTFALNSELGIYTPGVARDHRYRIPAIPESFESRSVLDVGTFDGFYAFLAESRGAENVVAVDNEQYTYWAKARWGTDLEGGEGFRAIAELLDSDVRYERLDAFDVDELDDRFDFVFCFGILHRVRDPLGLLQTIAELVDEGGQVLLETYGSNLDHGSAAVEVHEPGDVYARDDFVYWGFTDNGLAHLGRLAGFGSFKLIDSPVIDSHPRIIGALEV
jgi:tRNA (mo5U34)-methyltransferase